MGNQIRAIEIAFELSLGTNLLIHTFNLAIDNIRIP